MLKAKSKSQPARLLSYGQSTSTPIAMAITITAGGTILSILLQVVNIGMSSSTNRQHPKLLDQDVEKSPHSQYHPCVLALLCQNLPNK
jgi:hypothetical protein